MSDSIIIQPPQPLNVTIAQTDPAMAQTVDGFAQTLTALTAQINQAVASIGNKVDQSQITAIQTALDNLNTDIAALALDLAGKVGTNHTQPIASINGLTTALSDLQTQIANLSAPTLDADLQAIAQLSTASFGRGLLTLADLAAAKSLLQIPQIVDSPDDIGAQPSDSDLNAIANLVTTTFGRSLLTLTDQAALQQLVGIGSNSGSNPLAPTLLTYTVSQSGSYSNNTVGTYANLTNDNRSDGSATGNEGNPWIMATFSEPKAIKQLIVAGGSLSGWGAVASYLNTAIVEISLDNIDWTPILTLQGCTDSKSSTFLLNTPPIQYFRLRRTATYLSTTEFRLLG